MWFNFSQICCRLADTVPYGRDTYINAMDTLKIVEIGHYDKTIHNLTPNVVYKELCEVLSAVRKDSAVSGSS